jgi:hypothetical protein
MKALSLQARIKFVRYTHLTSNAMDITDKAFQYASETSKLLITLSTGVIAFTVTFIDKQSLFKPDEHNLGQRTILVVSWVLLLAAAIIGIWTQLALTDILEPKVKVHGYLPSIRNRKVKIPFQLQAIIFIAGIICTVIYGLMKII